MTRRRDAILREMGLAPLWRLRGAEPVEEAQPEPSAPVPEPVVAAPVSAPAPASRPVPLAETVTLAACSRMRSYSAGGRAALR